MEDGKNRHLFQLQPRKQQVLRTIPNEWLKDHLDFMKQNIEGKKFPLKLISCCLSNKYKRLNPYFTECFDSLPTKDKIIYYRKFIDISLTISKKKLKLPSTTNCLDQTCPMCENTTLQYRASLCEGWTTTSAALNCTTKILETLSFSMDLHTAFVYRPSSNKPNQDRIILSSWKGNCYEVEFMKNQLTDSNFFQRIENVADLAIEENIIRMIEGEEIVPNTESQESPYSQRSIKNRMASEVHQIALHSIKEVNLLNYLKYKHLDSPLEKQNQLTRLIGEENIHYFFQGEWEINSDGELIVINQKKLEAQGSVIKYIIKRLFSGTKIFSISLPVIVFNEESNLSLLLNSYRHAPIELEAAAKQQEPLKRFLKVIRFVFTCPPCYIRCDKPFNPLIGQTYQAIVDGTPFYGEQISHHPPISAVFIKGRGYTAYGHFQAQVKFGLNSASGNNKGWLNISFDPSDISKNIIRFNNTPGEMSGLLIGSRKLALVQKIKIIDEQNLLYSQIAFGQIKLQNVKQYKDSVQGKIVKLKKQIVIGDHYELAENDIQHDYGLISGRWLSTVFFNGTPLINTLEQHPPQVERYPALLPSDYSLREDVILKRGGDDQHSQTAKENIQQAQRADRKLRQKYQG